jgi:hypothetical protein
MTWKISIKIESSTFAGVVRSARMGLEHVVRAKSVRDIPLGYGWCGADEGSLSVSLTTPTQERIKLLRSEADALEAGEQS